MEAAWLLEKEFAGEDGLVETLVPGYTVE